MTSTGPVIQMTAYRVTDIQYKHYLNKAEFDAITDEKKKPTIKMGVALIEASNNGQVTMTAHIVRDTEQQIGDVTVAGFFKFRDTVTEADDKYRYLSTNGGAMLYPYLRTTVSMLTALDNPDTTVLPTVNFSDMYANLVKDDRDKQDESGTPHSDSE